MPPERLIEIETHWKPARHSLSQLLEAEGRNLENSHWDWMVKRSRVESGELLLIAVETNDEVQGLIALDRMRRSASLTTGASLVYVDYIESAPWNIRASVQPPRFLGVGIRLIAEAVWVSIEQGLDGRLGLHSLPQSEAFYEQRCRMRRIGSDPDYYDLTYFEYAEAEARAWLTLMRFSDE